MSSESLFLFKHLFGFVFIVFILYHKPQFYRKKSLLAFADKAAESTGGRQGELVKS